MPFEICDFPFPGGPYRKIDFPLQTAGPSSVSRSGSMMSSSNASVRVSGVQLIPETA